MKCYLLIVTVAFAAALLSACGGGSAPGVCEPGDRSAECRKDIDPPRCDVNPRGCK